MAEGIKISAKSMINSRNDLYKSVITSFSSKTTSSFKETLNTKNSNDTSYRNNSDKSVDNTNKKDINDYDDRMSRIEKLKDELEKLDDDSKSDSDDKVNDILTELMNLLNQLNKNSVMPENSSISNNLKDIDSNNSDDILNQLAKLLKSDSIKDKLDVDSLKSINKILNNLCNSSKTANSNIQDLMSQINNLLDEKNNGKVLTLNDLLARNNSQNNQESSTKNESGNSGDLSDNKELSKEDKFLNSLVDDKNNVDNKFNLFVSRNELIQNQNVADVSKNLTINKSSLVDDLMKDIKYMNTNGLKELTVKINPDNLGEVTISLTQEEGTMKATLKATSKDTANLLMQNLSEIKNQLNDKNIKIENVNIELYQEDTTFFKNGNFEGQSSKDGRDNTKSTKTIIDDSQITGNEELVQDIENVNDGNINYLA